MPKQSTIEAMRQECPNVDLELEHKKFVDYWTAATGSKATKLDWDATWRNWIRNARPGTQPRPGAGPTIVSTTDERIAAAQALKDPTPNVRPIRGIQA